MRSFLVRFGGIQATLCTENLCERRFVVVLSGLPPGPPPRAHHPGIRRIVKRGWGVLVPSYPGVQDSDGVFTTHGALTCARKSIRFLRRGEARERWGNARLTWHADEVALLGVSFGGAVALTACAQTDATRVLAIAPVTDWELPLGATTAGVLQVIRRAFPHTVRLGEGWSAWGHVNPADHVEELREKHVTLVHARDDPVVPHAHSATFARAIGCRLFSVRSGGHLDLTDVPARALTAFLSLPRTRRA